MRWLRLVDERVLSPNGKSQLEVVEQKQGLEQEGTYLYWSNELLQQRLK